MSTGVGEDGTTAKKDTKAIRFIMNCGAPNPKRRRIGAACLTCRKRKTACSGETPTCVTCKQNKQECAGYAESGTTRIDVSRSDSIDETLSRGTTQESGIVPQASLDSPEREASIPRRKRRRVSTLRRVGALPNDTKRIIPVEASGPKELAELDLDLRPRNRMPYFRWLGPTAIMPGFKQMVVKVKRHDTTEVIRQSHEGLLLSPTSSHSSSPHNISSLLNPTVADADLQLPHDLPVYDASSAPPDQLITHLAKTFFTHLGCNYPFLPRERFLRDLEEKQVDAVLVDSVCALAARFSTHPMITNQPHEEGKARPAEYGHVFAQRAKTALVDAFTCPSVAAVQAALLLAYNEFGESRDSGLWMYLGIAIRMAQDLGMHTLEGLNYTARSGPTPKMVKRASMSGRSDANDVSTYAPSNDIGDDADDGKEADACGNDEHQAVEQERVDTFWAVFLLDRVVSSGTGRRSTLRDKDIEISFPALNQLGSDSVWPAPFPALIRIVHLYGLVADLLNSITRPSDIVSNTPERLASMELQATKLYQGLSSRLHFDAVNFQHYVKAGEGTNFVLLHFWFHTLIILLHQPTLLKTFEGPMMQLFPNSQRLAMSSAKTIADILSYSQLMDAKASLGNPFTTQPIYIAACAFLKETAEQTASSNAVSRAASPTRGRHNECTEQRLKTESLAESPGARRSPAMPAENRACARHTLLATAATQHYQLCYKALQSLETYWAGAKYILTVLDQKFQGVGDPLLYTVEEGESSMERPRPYPAFTSPGWRRKLSLSQHTGDGITANQVSSSGKQFGSPTHDRGQPFGWTLTGTMNSPNMNLAGHYASNPTSALDIVGGNVMESRPHDFPHLLNDESLATTFRRNQNSVSGHPPHLDPLLTPLAGSNSYSFQIPFPTGPAAAQQTLPQHNPAYALGQETQDFSSMMIQARDVDMSSLGLSFDLPWFDAFAPYDGMDGFWDPGGGAV
ncbi:hypothetical protein LTR62_001059 [Meristemomyces frigidus]|uniref:Zn(2)-C6 fungal-type domain-containing protein n=1 Tax=Meristemomyces frigidus TaxID=1508187 RepID=A0AAN7TGP8_9PEZI|nr:hypothetical protein LTR62_001059 [Meristemomyces frigidus]